MYLWNAASGDIVQLCQTVTPDCYVGAVSWIKEGNFLALGDSNGVVQVNTFDRCRNFSPHEFALPEGFSTSRGNTYTYWPFLY